MLWISGAGFRISGRNSAGLRFRRSMSSRPDSGAASEVQAEEPAEVLPAKPAEVLSAPASGLLLPEHLREAVTYRLYHRSEKSHKGLPLSNKAAWTVSHIYEQSLPFLQSGSWEHHIHRRISAAVPL